MNRREEGKVNSQIDHLRERGSEIIFAALASNLLDFETLTKLLSISERKIKAISSKGEIRFQALMSKMTFQ